MGIINKSGFVIETKRILSEGKNLIVTYLDEFHAAKKV